MFLYKNFYFQILHRSLTKLWQDWHT